MTGVAWGVGDLAVGWTLPRTVLRALAERHDVSREDRAAIGSTLGGVVATFDLGIRFTFAFIGGSLG